MVARENPTEPITRLITADELADMLAPVATDYAVARRMTHRLPPTDRSRLLQRRRGAYIRALRRAITTAAWLTDEPDQEAA